MKGDPILASDDWECSNCGARNDKNIEVCVACGKRRSICSKANVQLEGTDTVSSELSNEGKGKHKSVLFAYYRLRFLPAYLIGILLAFVLSINFGSNIFFDYVIFALMVFWDMISGRFWLFFLTWIFAFYYINPDFFVGQRLISLIAEAFVLNIFIFSGVRKSIFVKVLFAIIIALGIIANVRIFGYSLLYDLWHSLPLFIAILAFTFLGVQLKIHSTLYNIFQSLHEDAY